MKKPYQQTMAELTTSLDEMLCHIEHMKKVSAAYRAPLPKSVVHYVGLNYELHLEILREKKEDTLADEYKRKWDSITTTRK